MTPTKLEIDWLRTIGGALAAVSSAVLLSTLGAAGTIIGAALGSVVVTVGGALYSQGLARSRERLLQAQTAALRKVGVAQAEVRRAGRTSGDGRRVDAHLAHAQATLDRAKDDLGTLSDDRTGSGWRGRLAVLPWKRIALAAAGLFAAAVVAITAFELLVGESVSSITGGSQGTARRSGASWGTPTTRSDRARTSRPATSRRRRPPGTPRRSRRSRRRRLPTPSDEADPVPLADRRPDPRADHPGGRADHDAASDPGLAPPAASAPAGESSRVSLSDPRAARRR